MANLITATERSRKVRACSILGGCGPCQSLQYGGAIRRKMDGPEDRGGILATIWLLHSMMDRAAQSQRCYTFTPCGNTYTHLACGGPGIDVFNADFQSGSPSVWHREPDDYIFPLPEITDSDGRSLMK